MPPELVPEPAGHRRHEVGPIGRCSDDPLLLHSCSRVSWFGLGPFLRPGLHTIEATRAAAVKDGHRPSPEAARSGLDRREHGARLDQIGPPAVMTLPCRVMVLSAVCVGQPQHGIGGRLAPLCPERGRTGAHRNGELGVARPRPGWDRLPPLASGGSRGLLAALVLWDYQPSSLRAGTANGVAWPAPMASRSLVVRAGTSIRRSSARTSALPHCP